MQRWWYVENNEIHKPCRVPIKNSEDTNGTSNELFREWTFNVLVTEPLNSIEKIAISGECSSLGNWNPAQAQHLEQRECKLNSN